MERGYGREGRSCSKRTGREGGGRGEKGQRERKGRGGKEDCVLFPVSKGATSLCNLKQASSSACKRNLLPRNILCDAFLRVLTDYKAL